MKLIRISPFAKSTFLALSLTLSALSGLSAAELNVLDYGAVGDGKHDDSQAFRDALTALAEAEKDSVLLVPKGSYLVMPEEGAGVYDGHINVSNQKDKTIKGEEGTLLLFGSSFNHGLMVRGSENVRIESIAVDYTNLPFTQGTIVSADPGSQTFVVELDEGYPRVTDPQIQAKNTKNIAYLYKPGTTLKLDEYYDQYIGKIKVLDGNQVQLKSRNPVEKAFVGAKVAMVGRRKADAVVFDRSSNCTAYKVSVYSAPALAFGIRTSDHITIDSCTVKQRPGTDRLMSSVADGVHVKWGSYGPLIQNCWFEGMGDDSVNIGSTVHPIYTQLDARTIVTDVHGSFKAHNDIQWVHRQTGEMESFPECVQIKSVQWEGKPRFALVFGEDLPKGIRAADSIAEGERADMVINMDQVPINPIVRNNFFGRHRERAILMRSPGAIIEGNRFEDLIGPAIKLGNYFTESPNGSNVIIRNNTFVNIRKCNITASDGLQGTPDAPARAIKNIEISNNRFTLYGLPAGHDKWNLAGRVLSISNAENVLIENNFIDIPRPELVQKERLVSLGEVANLTLKDTIIDGKPLPASEWLEIWDRADMDSVVIEQP